MKTNPTLNVATVLLAVAILTASSATGLAQGNAFNYQGRLNDGGAPANGLFDLRFSLWNAAIGPAQVGATLTNNAVVVNDGAFTVTLDFGPGVFTGAPRWLEIGVRANGAGPFTTLDPRQPVTATPYAITAGNVTGPVAANQLAGTISGNNIGAGSITTIMLAAGAVGSNQLAAGSVTTAALAEGAVTAPKVATVSHWVPLTIENPTPSAGDQFGSSVAAVGNDRVLVGAPADDTGGANAGAAYLLGTNGTLLTTFTGPNSTADHFGWSVAAVGSDRVLIGAIGVNTFGSDAGAAYLFHVNGTLITTFTNPEPAAFGYGHFGNSVAALDSDRVIIGANGRAHLFSTSGTLLATFANSVPGSDNYVVAPVGTDRVLVGASHDAGYTGQAYLFNTNGTLLITFTNSPPYWGFGSCVAAMGNDRVLIGSDFPAIGNPLGTAYLFSTNGTLLRQFTNSAIAWVTSVAATGTGHVLIGANSAAAYLFDTNGTLVHTFTSRSPAPWDSFGSAIAPAGNGGRSVLIGQPLANLGAPYSGAAHLFSLERYAPGIIAEAVRFGGVTSASIAPGSVMTEHLTAGAVTSQQLALGAVGSNHLAFGAVTTTAIAAGAITSNQIASSAVGSNQLASNAVTTAALDQGAVTADKVATIAEYPFRITITSPNPQASDSFGDKLLAFGSDRLLIGAPGQTPAGAAYLLRTNGALLATFTNPAPAFANSFGSALATVGTDRVLVGAFGGDGAAYLFRTNGTLLTTFSKPITASGYGFGMSVAAVGSDHVLVGAYGHNTGAEAAGAVYLFRTNGTLLTTFTNPAPAYQEWFGYSVAAVGTDRVLIGAVWDSGYAGAAYLYRTNGTVQTTFTNPVPLRGNFGGTVAAVGADRVLIAATGAAYLFNTNGALITTYTNPSPTWSGFFNESFGSSLAALGTDRVLIGAPWNSTGAYADGAAYLFSTNGTLLTAYTNPVAVTEVQLGSAVAAVGNDRVLVGARASYETSGSAYLFTTNGSETFTPGLVVEAVRPRAIDTSSLADGAVTAAKLDPAIGVWTRSGDHVFRLEGNVGIGTSAFTSNRLEVAGTVGATAFNSTSDRAAKQDFTTVDAQAVLAKVATLPITQWSFKEFPGTRHIGPMSQDFHAAFGVGPDDRHIATVDADGVALAAIQGLNQKLEEQRNENATLKQRLEKLELLIRQMNGGAK